MIRARRAKPCAALPREASDVSSARSTLSRSSGAKRRAMINPQNEENPPSGSRLRPLPTKIALVRFHIPNHKFVDRVTRLKSGNQPPGLFPTPGPSLRRLVRISVFCKHPRIFASLPRRIFRLTVRRLRLAHFFLATKLRQSLFELTFFRRQSDGEDRVNFLVQLPHFVDRHGIKIEFLAHPTAFSRVRFEGSVYSVATRIFKREQVGTQRGK